MKKIIIIASGILVFVLFLILILTRLKNRPPVANNQLLITPTLVESNIQKKDTKDDNSLNKLKSLSPYETDSFRYYYSSELNKPIVELKSDQGQKDFNDWIIQEGLSELIYNQNSQLLITSQRNNSNLNTSTVTPSPNPLDDFMKSLLGLGFVSFSNNASTSPTITQTPTTTIVPTGKKKENDDKTNNIFSQNFIYFGQCQSGDISLPDGCNLCQAGCGPTTAAMILSSYLSKEYDPKKVVSLYGSKDYYLGCGGSSYYDAKSLFEDLGLKTTDFISFEADTADEVASDFRKYIDGGWTLFTLANYCDSGCGHFFWITDIKGNNIYAYDPYYGQNEDPPINENDRYPYPKYRVAFGVKKG